MERAGALNALTDRLPEMEREATECEARARALRQIIDGIRALNGHASEITEARFVEQNGTVFVAQALDPDGPRGRQAVLRVMRTDPTRLWKVIELKREILRQGWAPSPKAVEATLKRMREAGEISCPQYGYYRLLPTMSDFDPAPPDNRASNTANASRDGGAMVEGSGGPQM